MWIKVACSFRKGSGSDIVADLLIELYRCQVQIQIISDIWKIWIKKLDYIHILPHLHICYKTIILQRSYKEMSLSLKKVLGQMMISRIVEITRNLCEKHLKIGQWIKGFHMNFGNCNRKESKGEFFQASFSNAYPIKEFNWYKKLMINNWSWFL